MKRLYKFFFLLFLVPVSCSKHLDVEPTSAITNNSFWKTENDATGALYGMYFKLLKESNTGNFYYLGEARSEIMTSSIGGTNGYERYYQQSLSPTTPGPNWIGLYSIINAANLILKHVPDINFVNPANKNAILAQAYTMRAYIYFVLVRTWGDVPLRLEPIEEYDPVTVQFGKSSAQDVFKQIKNDLAEAIKSFPDNNIPSGRYIWSLPGANALKADVYLWTGKQQGGGNADFTIALSALNAVQTADVQLLPKFSDIFEYTNKGNKEVIMVIKSLLIESGDNFYANMYLQTTNIPSNVTQGTKDTIGVGGGQNIWSPTAAVRAQFTSDDQRKFGTFYEIQRTTNPSYYATLAMKGRGTISGGLRFFVNDVVIYRYADILLMKAEAKNALSQDPTAEMNLVRQRAYGTNFPAHQFVNGSQAANDDAILKERLLELMLEGKRWWDEVRFNKAFELVPALNVRPGDKNFLLFPIGSDVLSLEPKVTQNTGW